jgi:hypothetical protein
MAVQQTALDSHALAEVVVGNTNYREEVMSLHYILIHEWDTGCPAHYEHFQGTDERPCYVCGVLLVKEGEGQ